MAADADDGDAGHYSRTYMRPAKSRRPSGSEHDDFNRLIAVVPERSQDVAFMWTRSYAQAASMERNSEATLSLRRAMRKERRGRFSVESASFDARRVSNSSIAV
jgi:hypothetical protein